MEPSKKKQLSFLRSNFCVCLTKRVHYLNQRSSYEFTFSAAGYSYRWIHAERHGWLDFASSAFGWHVESPPFLILTLTSEPCQDGSFWGNNIDGPNVSSRRKWRLISALNCFIIMYLYWTYQFLQCMSVWHKILLVCLCGAHKYVGKFFCFFFCHSIVSYIASELWFFGYFVTYFYFINVWNVDKNCRIF